MISICLVISIFFYISNNMMPTITDYIIIAIACIGIAFVIGMCIVSVVDKKMSDIVINVPKPEVTVNIKEDCSSKKTVEEFTPTSKKKDDEGSIELKQNKLVNPATKKAPISMKKNGMRFLNAYEQDDELYPDVEGTRQYAVMGCRDRTKKFKLYPNMVACAMPNYLTAENYYTKNFEYPVLPGQSEERNLGADYDEVTSFGKPDVSYRLIVRNRNKLSNKPPFPANYWFK